jgi:parallel beta-helix repeat protein
MLTLLILTGMLTLTFNTQPVKAWSGTIYIKADGSIYPSGAPVKPVGNVYTLTDDISSLSGANGIVIEKDDIIIDGAGHTIKGTSESNTIGVKLYYRKNVTIKNIKVKDYWKGINIWGSSSISLTGCTIINNLWSGLQIDGSTDCYINKNVIMNNSYGIVFVESSKNLIFENNITNNDCAVHLVDSLNNKFWHNNFINNNKQVSFEYFEYSTLPNTWDDGYPSGGNYWSDCSGIDERYGPNQDERGSDGIYDAPYVINKSNRDNYPLVEIIPEFSSIQTFLLVLAASLILTLSIRKRSRV